MSIIFAMSAKFSLRDNSIAKHVPTTMVVTFKKYIPTYLYSLKNLIQDLINHSEFHETGGFSLKGMINVQ